MKNDYEELLKLVGGGTFACHSSIVYCTLLIETVKLGEALYILLSPVIGSCAGSKFEIFHDSPV